MNEGSIRILNTKNCTYSADISNSNAQQRLAEHLVAKLAQYSPKCLPLYVSCPDRSRIEINDLTF